MIIVKHRDYLSECLEKQRSESLSIGFVPTMGALHEGHLELIKTSLRQCDVTVCSIFVNPTQFNDPKDYEKYPQQPEEDARKLEAAGATILFTPPVNEVYPRGMTNLESYDLGQLESILDGKYRPGHFQGVCQVMQRLLSMVQPDILFMGQKDYQQCMVVETLLRVKLHPVHLVRCPTKREPDGLAMSSRNLKLSSEERKKAPAIFQTLNWMNQQQGELPLALVKEQALEMLRREGFSPDYCEVADANNLQLLNEWTPGKPMVALIAAFLGDVRLIDNLLLT